MPTGFACCASRGPVNVNVNVNLQALASQHCGASASIVTVNMLWFDSFTGEVKLHGPTNTAWYSVGTIGPPGPMDRFDIPLTAFTTGDVKNDLKAVADAGWLMMNNG